MEPAAAMVGLEPRQAGRTVLGRHTQSLGASLALCCCRNCVHLSVCGQQEWPHHMRAGHLGNTELGAYVGKGIQTQSVELCGSYHFSLCSKAPGEAGSVGRTGQGAPSAPAA